MNGRYWGQAYMAPHSHACRSEALTHLGHKTSLLLRCTPPPRSRPAIVSPCPESLARIGAFLQALQQLGWTDGRNVRIEYRWGSADTERIRKSAAELVELMPEVIMANGTTAMGPLRQATRTLPIVFVNVSDPVGAGFVASLARPGGNATGFASI